jgi:hypothetical protein
MMPVARGRLDTVRRSIGGAGSRTEGSGLPLRCRARALLAQLVEHFHGKRYPGHGAGPVGMRFLA